ncbi:MAG: DNA repair protein RecO, partial [Gemmatimonadetes bacterium]|nr:DNA repair protein RecO [Gemmatimonadota bacterium]
MPLISVPAIILQSFAYSDTSKILRLLTRTHGVRSAIAKGALRPRSRFGGVLEPFTEGVATFYLKEGRELQTLSGFELGRSRQRLGRDLLRFGSASLLAELVLRTASEEPEPELFERVRAALDQLEDAPPQVLEGVALAACWSLLGHLGFAPALDACIACARPLADDDDGVFDFAAGGVRCPACAAGAPGRALPAHARRTLARLCLGEIVPLERHGAHWQLLGRFVAHHVADQA